jgi:hypothetical protein
MKRIILILTFLITFAFSTLAVTAAGNNLHTITLEKNNTGYNIVLGSDKIAKVVKKTPANNELIMEITGITSSETVNAIYKGTNSIEGLIIENTAPNKLRISITAENIKNSTVMMESLNGETTIVGETVPVDKILWAIFVMALFGVIFKVSKDITEEDDKILIKKDIKDREIQMYRKYRSEMSINTGIDNRTDLRMRKMVKKIDRKIDERLTSAIR